MKATRHGLPWRAAAILMALFLIVPVATAPGHAQGEPTVQPPASRYVIQIGSYNRLTGAEATVSKLQIRA